MPKIYVDFTKLQEIENKFENITSKIDTLKSDFFSAIRELDWKVQSEYSIRNKSLKISENLQKDNIALKKYKQFLEQTIQKYRELENADVRFEPSGSRNNIFNGSNGYGGDQGRMAHSKCRRKFFGEDQVLFDFIRHQNGYENYTEAEIYKFMEQIDEEGCGYVALVNTLFWEFPGTEEEFEKLYGFPMRDKYGNYNFDLMLIDIYCKTDDKYFLNEDGGKEALITDVLISYLDPNGNYKKDKFEQDYGVRFDDSSNEVSDEMRNAILNRYKSNEDVATYKTKGTRVDHQENRLRGYLKEKGIDADVNYSVEQIMTIEDVKSKLDSGTVVELGVKPGTNFYDVESNCMETIKEGHAVVITEVTEDGKYVVSSWGKKYYLDPSQVCKDTQTGHNESIINDYLLMNVEYK